EYGYLGGSIRTCELQPIPATELPPARDRLEALLRTYANEAQPYTAPETSKERYNDYEHLTRRKEWDTI
ncbi:MAG: hypothetical protein K2Q01_11620, partial [Rickettsiales bacterium]|nr:hypothetical protein [Rickettsiales bacterium]